jgi:hypothetical protein
LSLAVVHRRHLFDVAGGGGSAVSAPAAILATDGKTVGSVAAGTSEQTRHANDRPPPARRQVFSVRCTISAAASASRGVFALRLMILLVVPTFSNSPFASIRERRTNLSEWCL